MRPVDGDRLKQVIKQWIDTLNRVVDVETCEIVLNLIDVLPTLTPPNEWVSVEERLPPPNVRVLAYRPDEDDNSPYKYTNMWGWAVKESIRHKGITHWTLLPAPPTKEE